MPALRFFRGTDLLAEYRLRPGRTTIGRADQCDVALPGETISRVHCVVQGRRDEWEILDRSRHGLTVDDRPVDGKATLQEGSVITFGPYRVEVSLTSREARPTAPQEPEQTHEILLGNDKDGLRVERAALVVVAGEQPGQRLPLRHSRLSVGGPGSHIALPDAGLAKDHAWLRISRGRAMVEPGAGATFLDGERLRDVTPLYSDEEFRIGRTVLRVERDQEEELPLASRFGEMVAESRSMRQLFGTLRRMAGHHYTVLVVGESGTGKELIARGIHQHSPRAEGPFVALNCGAITDSLFESELFGHEKGAFTGADKRRNGAFLEADQGTLFLDEVGELPEAAQAKLLRTLETGEVRRVGSTEVSYPDVRVVAATNRDLARAVREGSFREDLFFRLAVLTVTVPPLRERAEDLGLLSRFLCRKLDPRCQLSPDAQELLARHSWPGNVRELRNVLTRAFVLGGPQIGVQDLTFHKLTDDSHLSVVAESPVEVAFAATERDFLRGLMARHADNRSAAARELGVARSTLHYKLKKHGLSG